MAADPQHYRGSREAASVATTGTNPSASQPFLPNLLVNLHFTSQQVGNTWSSPGFVAAPTCPGEPVRA